MAINLCILRYNDSIVTENGNVKRNLAFLRDENRRDGGEEETWGQDWVALGEKTCIMRRETARMRK